MAKFAHIKNGRIHWIAPADQGPELFVPGFLVAVPDTANEGDLWDGVNVMPPPQPNLAELRADAVAMIDTAAGRARARYITTAPGQEAVYIIKDHEAREYKAAGYPASPVPPFVQADADALGLTPQQAADGIIAQADAWIAIGSQIELERRKGKAAVQSAIDQAGIDATVQATIAVLDSL